jgi:hypothetical protein
MEYGICNLSVVPLRAEAKRTQRTGIAGFVWRSFEILEWKEKLGANYHRF